MPGLATLSAFALLAPSPASARQQLPEPVVVQGRISPAGEAAAAQLFNQAETAFEDFRYDEARTVADSIVRAFPTAPVSGRALLLHARSSMESGIYQDADASAERYVRLLAADDPRQGELRLLQARARLALDDPVGGLERLLRILSRPPEQIAREAIVEARRIADRLEPAELDDVVTAIPAGALVAPVLQARYARELRLDGFEERADAFARAALAGGAVGPDEDIANTVLRSTSTQRSRRSSAGLRVRLATVLPQSGSPVLSEFGNLVAEGVAVAAATMRSEGIEVEITAHDSEGDAGLAADIVRDIERDGVLGAVGFLEDASFEAAGRARRRGLPLVSPTARSAERAGLGAYSLEGPDREAATAVAEHAFSEGILRLAIVHSRAPASVAEADAFQARAEALGMPVVGRFAYEDGVTFFGPQIQGAARALRAEEIAALELGEEDTLHVELLDPVALFMPIPFEDVEFVAPQVTHYGLDTLGISILGTSGWTRPEVLETVDARHTSGVVATAPLSSGAGTPGYIRFERAYEGHFQRTLVSPIPALGYDAALLLLEAARERARSPDEVRRVIERITDFEGATGIFSVIARRVVRRTEVVLIEHGMLVPVGGFRFGTR